MSDCQATSPIETVFHGMTKPHEETTSDAIVSHSAGMPLRRNLLMRSTCQLPCVFNENCPYGSNI
ncbi:hypothetical protein Dsi01nite_104530 [Dactylosporangium siamense]|uniref:Uncharacterized protein n=1 Tax=Dactylosporangium siamense TaxID=685454 RepID=A0A919PZC2_9ACTN|nr:hypothetical protein Dsi01nite_104530 [Dactylosporangium siamense]